MSHSHHGPCALSGSASKSATERNRSVVHATASRKFVTGNFAGRRASPTFFDESHASACPTHKRSERRSTYAAAAVLLASAASRASAGRADPAATTGHRHAPSGVGCVRVVLNPPRRASGLPRFSMNARTKRFATAALQPTTAPLTVLARVVRLAGP